MTDKELQKLSRADLLELLLEQSREVERLETELRAANERLESRRITAERAGSIAQAALQLNGVFQAAQQAADQYVENVRREYETVTRSLEAAKRKTAETEARCREMEAEAQASCARMVQQAREQADACWRNALRQAERYWGGPAPLSAAPERPGEEKP